MQDELKKLVNNINDVIKASGLPLKRAAVAFIWDEDKLSDDDRATAPTGVVTHTETMNVRDLLDTQRSVAAYMCALSAMAVEVTASSVAQKSAAEKGIDSSDSCDKVPTVN